LMNNPGKLPLLCGRACPEIADAAGIKQILKGCLKYGWLPE
jgi:hypothetical protein